MLQKLKKQKQKKKTYNFAYKMLSEYILLLPSASSSIPSIGDYNEEYTLHCNFSWGNFHRGGFPLPSPEGIRL